MVRDGDAADRDNDFRHRNRHPDAGNVPQDYDGDDVDPDNGPEDVLPCYSYQPNGTADMNLNPTLVKNIRQHDYFKGLSDFRTFTSVIDEIYERCTSVLFWMSGTRRQVSQGLQDRGVSAGGVPSTTVILLYKLYTLRLTRKQIKTMLNHPDTPYIRALAVLYLRHVCDPKELWGWLQPYVTDPEPIDTLGDGQTTPFGRFVCRTLTEPEHVERDVRFPRLPVLVHRDVTAKLAERGLARPPEQAGADRDRGRDDRDRDRGWGGDRRHWGGDGGSSSYGGGGSSSHQRERDDGGGKRRALDGGARPDGGAGPVPEKRKCEYCKRKSCIC